MGDGYPDNPEVRLAQARKMELIGRITGGMAHDFNNMLTGILGYASLLKTTLPPGSEEFEAAAYIETAAKRAADMTRKLLAYARRHPTSARTFSLNEAIREAVEILSRTVGGNVRLRTDLQSADPVVRGDSGALVESLIHMGVNAGDAMPEGGDLTFSTSDFSPAGTETIQGVPIPEGAYCMLRVSDTGHGIPERDRNRIFEPFFTTKGPGIGTGLGLAMAYGCVKSHKGFLFLDSEEGRGSTFTILLPLSDTAEARAEPASPGQELSKKIERVLVIDDDEIPLRFASDILRSLGYETLSALSGEEGVALFRSSGSEIQAVIIDMIMPGMSGAEAAKRIREIDPRARLILCSGYHPDDRETTALLREFDALLPKPYRQEDIERVLRNTLPERE